MNFLIKGLSLRDSLRCAGSCGHNSYFLLIQVLKEPDLDESFPCYCLISVHSQCAILMARSCLNNSLCKHCLNTSSAMPSPKLLYTLPPNTKYSQQPAYLRWLPISIFQSVSTSRIMLLSAGDPMGVLFTSQSKMKPWSQEMKPRSPKINP